MIPSNDEVIVYKAKDGWRWRRTDLANGQIVSESGEAYHDRGDCFEAAEALNADTDVYLEAS